MRGMGGGRGGCEVSTNELSCAHGWRPNKLWRSNSIFNLWFSIEISSFILMARNRNVLWFGFGCTTVLKKVPRIGGLRMCTYVCVCSLCLLKLGLLTGVFSLGHLGEKNLKASGTANKKVLILTRFKFLIFRKIRRKKISTRNLSKLWGWGGGGCLLSTPGRYGSSVPVPYCMWRVLLQHLVKFVGVICRLNRLKLLCSVLYAGPAWGVSQRYCRGQGTRGPPHRHRLQSQGKDDNAP